MVAKMSPSRSFRYSLYSSVDTIDFTFSHRSISENIEAVSAIERGES
jgi:hypothetical protein